MTKKRIFELLLGVKVLPKDRNIRRTVEIQCFAPLIVDFSVVCYFNSKTTIFKLFSDTLFFILYNFCLLTD